MNAQIGHSIVLETKGGKARLFQTFVREPECVCARLKWCALLPTPQGYSAREWCARKPRARRSWPGPRKAAHARWGGGRELSLAHGDIWELMALCLSLQRAAKKITAALLPQLPPGLLEAEAQ